MAEHWTGPRIETRRLLLRPPLAADLDAWAAFRADPEAMRFLGGVQPRSVAWRGLATVAGSWMLHGFGQFSVIERASGAWVGTVGPWRPEGWPGTEVGWSIAPSHQGRGYATEAATAAIGWAIEALGWDRVVHVIDPGNTASEAVARRLGSTPLGPTRLPEPYEDASVTLWGQSAAEWRQRRSA